jgi:hypothetical protein
VDRCCNTNQLAPGLHDLDVFIDGHSSLLFGYIEAKPSTFLLPFQSFTPSATSLLLHPLTLLVNGCYTSCIGLAPAGKRWMEDVWQSF